MTARACLQAVTNHFGGVRFERLIRHSFNFILHDSLAHFLSGTGCREDDGQSRRRLQLNNCHTITDLVMETIASIAELDEFLIKRKQFFLIIVFTVCGRWWRSSNIVMAERLYSRSISCSMQRTRCNIVCRRRRRRRKEAHVIDWYRDCRPIGGEITPSW